MKKGIVIGAICAIGSFIGLTTAIMMQKPDGYLYLDKDTNSIYAQLEQDPSKYRKNAKLIFVYKG